MQKAPSLKSWQKLQLSEADLSDYFHDGDGVGVLLGKPSKGLTDTDLDSPEAIFLAPSFLPHTGRIFGHRSKPESHRLYYWKSTLEPEKFTDVDGTSLIEIRSSGQQTVLPPSIHPSGERIRWTRRKRATRVKARKLRAAVCRVAAGAILARHWPKPGSRNEAALALGGMLLRAGWEDEEAAEFVGSVAQAANDEEWHARKQAAFGTRKRLDKGGDATGRPTLAELVGAEAVKRACDWLGIGRVEVATRRTTPKRVPWPEPLSKRAFYGLAGDAVRMIAPESEADPAALLVQILIAFGSAVGRGPHFEVEAAKHGTNLFGLIVGRTSKARKGTSWAHVLRIFREIEPDWYENCMASGLSSGEGVISAVRDATEKRKRTKSGKTSGEKEIDDPGVEDKRLMIFEGEFASALRAQRREGNTLSAQVRQAWDIGNLRVLTKNTPVQATDAHISIIGHITQQELRRELTATDEANGYANRFLFVCSKRSKQLPLGGNIERKVIEELASRFRRAARNARRLTRLKFTHRAKKLWFHVYPELTADVPGLLGAIISRAEAQVLRIAVIYALLDCSPPSLFIHKRHLKAALSVWRYCADSARYIFGDALGDRLADDLLRALRKKAEGLTRTEIRELFSRNRNESEISRALEILAELGLARSVSEETGGRPAERWFAS